MPYQAILSRKEPGCVLIFVNMSDSMDLPFFVQEETVGTRKQACLQAINRFLIELIWKSTRVEEVLEYFEVGVFGYRFERDGKILFNNLLPSSGAKKMLWSTKMLADLPLKIEQVARKIYDDLTGVSDYIARIPIWIENDRRFDKAIAVNFENVFSTLTEWVSQHSSSFPPIVLHLTDASQLSDELISSLKSLRSVKTRDGETLVFNCVLTTTSVGSLLFPSANTDMGESAVINFLFRESSELPEVLASQMQKEYRHISSDSKAFGLVTTIQMLNSFLAMVLRAFQIGTRSVEIDKLERTYDRAMDRIYRERAEARAEVAERRARQSHVFSIIAIIVAVLSFIASTVELFLRAIGVLP